MFVYHISLTYELTSSLSLYQILHDPSRPHSYHIAFLLDNIMDAFPFHHNTNNNLPMLLYMYQFFIYFRFISTYSQHFFSPNHHPKPIMPSFTQHQNKLRILFNLK